MRGLRLILFLCGAGLLVSACSVSREVAYDRSNAGVQKIGLLTPGFPKKAHALDIGSSAVDKGAVAGPIGAVLGSAVDFGLKHRRKGRLDVITEEKQFQARSVFMEELTRVMQVEGYEIVYVESGAAHRENHLDDIPDKIEDVDALFDVVTTDIGFLSSGGLWRPHMQTLVRLRRADDNVILMQNKISYNDVSTDGHHVSISPDAQYGWKKFDDLAASPDEAVAALEDAIKRSVSAISVLLK